ncbi:phage tail component protein, partial [Opisthorchis viverrini]
MGAVYWCFLEILSLMHMALYHPTFAEEYCNTMVNSWDFPHGATYMNDDRSSRGIAYMSTEGEVISFQTDPLNVVESILSLDVRQGNIIFRCRFEDACCRKEVSKSETCKFPHSAVQTGSSVMYFTASNAINEHNLLILFLVKRHSGYTGDSGEQQEIKSLQKYFSTHPNRNDTVVCPQFGKYGHWTEPPKVGQFLRKEHEIHRLEPKQVQKKADHEEYTNLTFNLCMFSTDLQTKEFWHIYYRKETDTFKITKTPLIQSRVTNSNCTYTSFTHRIQWHSKFRQHSRNWEGSLMLARHTKAILFLSYESRSAKVVDGVLRSFLRKWIVERDLNHRWSWPDSVQYPAIQMTSFTMRRNAIFQEGQDKILWIDEDEIHHTIERYCCKRLTRLHDCQETKRMLSRPGKPYFEMRKLTIRDSGMYTCRNPPGVKPDHNFVTDYYIIVLPRKKDVNAYLSERSLSPKDVIVDNYPTQDVLNRSYFNGNNPVYANCIYLLSKGLDNHDGYRINYSIPGNYKQTANFTRDLGDMFIFVASHAIEPEYDDLQAVVSEFTCSYYYSQTFYLVQHLPNVPNHLSRVVSSRTLVALRHNSPKIITSSIETSEHILTNLLRRPSVSLADLYQDQANDKWVKDKMVEGLIYGSFVVLVNEYAGWSSTTTYKELGVDTSVVANPCTFHIEKLVINPGDYLLSAPEMVDSYTLIAKQVQFQCMIVLNSRGMALGAYNPKHEQIDRNKVELDVNNRIIHLLSKPDQKVQHQVSDLEERISAEFKLARWQVGWRGTINVGERIKMFWHANDTKSSTIRCKYKMDETSVSIPAPESFEVRTFMKHNLFELVKWEASELDSGLYQCYTCQDCPELDKVIPRRLVVLPDPSKIHLSVDYGSANHSGSGTKEDPIETTAVSMLFKCSYLAYGGLTADVSLVVTYETCIPNKEEKLQLKTIENQRMSEPLGNFTRLYVVFTVTKPEAYEYWEYVTVSCIVLFSKLIRDPYDIFDDSDSHNLTKSLYYKFDLPRSPVILREFIESSSSSVTLALRHENASDLMSFTSGRQVREIEHVCTFDYTVFMGLPKGWTRTWTIAETETGFKSVDCVLNRVYVIKDPKSIHGLMESKIYTVNSGINFEQHRYTCLLDIHTVAVILIAFQGEKTNSNVSFTISALKQRFLSQVENKGGEANMTELSLLEITKANFLWTKLEILWTATVNVGQQVQMLGYNPPEGMRLQCFQRRSVTDGYSPTNDDVTYSPVEFHQQFVLVRISNVSYSHSGDYKCNATGSCNPCPAELGMAPRLLIVLPYSNMLKMHLNHEPLKDSDNESVPHFNQCFPNGSAFLHTAQMASVRCIYPLALNTRLSEKPVVIFESFHPGLGKYKVGSTERATNFTRQTTSLPEATISHNIYAPDGFEFSGHLKVTCRLQFRIGTIPHDVSEPRGVIDITKSREILVKLSAPPEVYLKHISTQPKETLENWRRVCDNSCDVMNAVQFHFTAQNERRKEGFIDVTSIQSLGVPRGVNGVWLIYVYNENKGYDECHLTDSRQPAVPHDIRERTSYRSSGGRNLIQVEFRCSVQAQHVALVLVAYNSFNESVEQNVWDKKVATAIANDISYWLKYPEDMIVRPCTTYSEIRVSCGIIKLNVHWVPTVTFGTVWRIFLRAYKSRNVLLKIYHQPSIHDKKKLTWVYRGYSMGSWTGRRKANWNDSGIYTCKVEGNLKDTEHRECFLPHRLIVLPETNLLNLYLLNDLLKPNQKIGDTFSQNFLETEQRAYAYCVYLRPFGYVINETITFRYFMEEKFVDTIHYLPAYSQPKIYRNSTSGLQVIAPYLVVGPAPYAGQTKLNFTCRVSFEDNGHNRPASDLTKHLEPIIVSRLLLTKLRVKPVIFGSVSFSDSVDMTQWLRTSLKETYSPKEFQEASQTKALEEGLFEFTIFASVGVPRGWVRLSTFVRDGRTISEEQCDTQREIPLSPQSLPEGLLLDQSYSEIHERSVVKVTFDCAIRVENFALTATAFTHAGEMEKPEITEMTVRYLGNWFRRMLDSPSSTEELSPQYPHSVLVGSATMRLRVTWFASLQVGGNMQMLGYFTGVQDHIMCVKKRGESDEESLLDSSFKVERLKKVKAFTLTKENVSFSDTALFSCLVTPSSGSPPRLSIASRQLVVLPDDQQVHMFLTHKPLAGGDRWEANFNHCDAENIPYMFVGTTIFVHCLHRTFHGQWLQVTVTSELFLFTSYNQTEWVDSGLPQTFVQPNSTLNSWTLKPVEVRGNEMELTAKCIWQYDFPQAIPNDISQNNKSIVLTETKLIRIRLLKHPFIHNQMIESDDPITQDVMRQVTWGTQSAVQFHSQSQTITGKERTVRVNLTITLGVPRGWANLWSVYRYQDKLFKETCFLENFINITDQSMPASLKDDTYRPDIEYNVVNISWACTFLRESVAIFVTTLVCQYESLDCEKVLEEAEQSLLNNLLGWIKYTNSEDLLPVFTTDGLYLVYRTAKLLITWMDKVTVGSPVKMLGYFYEIKGGTIECFHYYAKTHHQVGYKRGFLIEPHQDGVGFSLLKTSIEFGDYGIYACNTTLPKSCPGCATSVVSIPPRRLTVIPDDSVVKLYLTNALIPSAVEWSAQDSLEDRSILECEQVAYAYCEYLQPKGLDSNATHKFHAEKYGTRNRVTTLPVKLVQQNTLDFDVHMIIQYVYELKAPKSSEHINMLNLTCIIKYGEINLAFTKSKLVEIEARVPSVLFVDTIHTSRASLTEALKNNTGLFNQSKDQFHSSGIHNVLLEGSVMINYSVGLGMPRGWSEVNVIYEMNQHIYRRVCPVHSEVKLSDVPGRIRASEYFSHTNGFGLTNYTLRCPLTLDVLAISLVVMNDFKDNVSSVAKKADFYRSLESSIHHFYFNTTGTESDRTIRIPPNSSVQLSLVRLNIGWRAAIPLGTPLIIYGFLPDGDVLNQTTCYYKPDDTEIVEPTKLSFDSHGFIIYHQPTVNHFELIKPVSSPNDSGHYECVHAACTTCAHTSVVVPHFATILASQLVLYTHLSIHSARSHSSNHSSWVYTQYDNESNPFVYDSQQLLVTCDYHTDADVNAPPLLQLRSSHISADSTTTVDVPSSFIEKLQSREESYLAIYSTFLVKCPLNARSRDLLRIVCELQMPLKERKEKDINPNSILRRLERSVQLYIQLHAKPRIITSTILTNDSQTTKMFQSDKWNQPTAKAFLTGFDRKPTTEGVLTVSYSVHYGLPVGWSSAVSIYNQTHGFAYRRCRPKDNNFQQQKGVDQATYLTEHTTQSLRYLCLMLPEHIGLLIYVAHYPEGNRNQTFFEQAFFSETTSTVERWFHKMSGQIILPAGSEGDYRLCPIPVGWESHVNIGKSVIMYGLLDEYLEKSPVCFYGYGELNNKLTQEKNFVVQEYTTYRFFVLFKPSVQFGDSGVYHCTIPQCFTCTPPIGLPTRTLVVLPDSSILELYLRCLSYSDEYIAECPDTECASVAPGEEIEIKCTHVVSKSVNAESEQIISHGPVDDESINSRIDSLLTTTTDRSDDLIIVTSTTKLKIPASSANNRLWRIRCQLPYDEAYRGLTKTKRYEPKPLSKEKQFTISNLRDPRVLAFEVRDSEGKIVHNILTDTYHSSNKIRFIHDVLGPLATEGVYRVNLTVFPGLPVGWIFVRMFYVRNNQLYAEPCLDISTLNYTRYETLEILSQSSCTVQPEHVAISFGVTNSPSSGWTKERSELELETSVVLNISKWMGYNGDQRRSKTISRCINYDLRLLRVKVGWRALVESGGTVQMQGRLDMRQLDNIQCFHRKSEKHAPQSIMSTYDISVDKEHDRFYLTKINVDYRDTGLYYCNTTQGLNDSRYVGMQVRRLSIIPLIPEAECKLTRDKAGKIPVSAQQALRDKQVYLLSGQSAFFHCNFSTQLDEQYVVIYDVLYTDKQFRKSFEKLLVTEDRHATSLILIYRIIAPRARDTTAPLQLHCVYDLPNMTTLDDGHAGKLRQTRCNKWFTIREPANGNLSIKTTARDPSKFPVPLGTVFQCTGGFGMPKLTYHWQRVKSSLYMDQEDSLDLASQLPADGGGWGGPRQPFIDMPVDNGLEASGPILRVPDDPIYRGMSYAYICKGRNVVHGVAYAIETFIHFTVLVCPTDHLRIDLSIFLSPRLLSACTLVKNPIPSIQFYGYFYLTLVRQLILGIPSWGRRTRFSIVRLANTENQNIIEYEASEFNALKTSAALVKSLYSKEIRPVSAQCSSPPVDLAELLHTVNNLYSHDHPRDPVFLLTVDSFTNVDNSSRLSNELQRMHQAGIKVILGFVYSEDNPLFHFFSEHLITMLQPFRVVYLTPRFEGVSKCGDCELLIDSPKLRIHRAGVFDAVCNSSNASRMSMVTAPRLDFSIPDEHLFHGLTLLATCTQVDVSESSEKEVNELTICLTDQSKINQLEKISEPNIQHLSYACAQRLAESSSPGHKSFKENDEVNSLTARVILQENSNLILLCYHRFGGIDVKIQNPVLYIDRWDDSETRPAVFQCVFKGFTPSLTVLLLFRANTTHLKTTEKYSVIAQSTPHFNTKTGITKVQLNWLERPHGNTTGEFVCLVVPSDLYGEKQHVITELPLPSALIQHSAALSMPRSITDCPTAPNLLISHKNTSGNLEFGASYTVVCASKAASESQSLKLYYLTPSVSLFLCYRYAETSESGVNPCFRTTADDTDCSKHLNASERPEKSVYSTRCLSRLEKTKHTGVVHHIVFEIKTLGIDDFNGHFFCQTVYVVTFGTQEEAKIREKLTSSLHTLKFNLPPSIVYFHFNPESQRWECRVAAFPINTTARLNVIRVTPRLLRKQLGLYRVETDKMPPALKDQHLIPKGLATKKHNMEYTITLIFRPIVEIPGGLTKGKVIMQCTFAETWQTLVTDLGEPDEVDEPSIFSPTAIPQCGREIIILCAGDTYSSDMITSMSLHRAVESPWANYDVLLLTVPLLEADAKENIPIPMGSKFHLFGSWAIGRRPQVRVLTDYSGWDISVDIGMLES